MVSNALSVCLAAVVSYFVVGGILVGEITVLTGASPLVPLALLALTIVVIGGLEGLQISVSSLYRKDLAELRDRYPRAFRIHGRFEMREPVVQRFFAGRQLLIVVIVFVASRLTTFPGMRTFPFTEVAFPAVASPWFRVVFLEFGLLGAVFVYWFGNLAAQLVATEYPVAFLDLPGMGGLFECCLFLDRVGLPRTSKWTASLLAGWLFGGGERPPDRIPLSAEQKYRRELNNDSGFVVAERRKRWRFDAEGLWLCYEVTYEIGREGISAIDDETLRVPAPAQPELVEFEVRLLDGATTDADGSRAAATGDVAGDGATTDADGATGGAAPTDGSDRLDGSWSSRTDEGGTAFTFRAVEPRGAFTVGDRVRFRAELVASVTPLEFTTDRVRVDHPARKVALRAEFDGELYDVDPPVVSEYNPVDDRVSGTTLPDPERLSVAGGDRRFVSSAYEESFPQEGSAFEIEWRADYRAPTPADAPADRALDADSGE